VSAAGHNLALHLPSFVGREAQLGSLARLLQTGRLVTLTGPGGVGKTRLALQAAGSLLTRYPDGVWLVELASLTASASLPGAMAAALDLQEESGRDLLAVVTAHLRHRHTLLVLDNCEHLVRMCASLATQLLGACPRLHILATSREPLNVPGESILPVPPLRVPPGTGPLTPESALEHESVQLLAERARALRPDFRVEAENVAAVSEICRRLGGVPLALELAASRLKVLSPAQIAERLHDQFRLLAGHHRDAPPHQQTLRKTLDWSYDLLTPGEQQLWARLTVFRGECDLTAVEAVCAGDGLQEEDILDLLVQLVDKSVVSVEEHHGAKRYFMLEPIWQYGRERLLQSAEAEPVRDRHLHWALELARAAEHGLVSGGQLAWLAHLDLEHDNLRAALDWSEAGGDPVAGLEIGACLWRFWIRRGYLAEGRERLERLLSSPQIGPHTRARALNAAGQLAEDQGDCESAVSAYEQALVLYREAGHEPYIPDMLSNLGNLACKMGDFDRARLLYEESLRRYWALGNQWAIAMAHSNLGTVAHCQEEYDWATRYLREGLSIQRRLSDKWGIARSLNTLGQVALDRGDLGAARHELTEALPLWKALGDARGLAVCLANLGVISCADGDLPTADALLRKSLRLRRERDDQEGTAHALEALAGVAVARQEYRHAAVMLGAAGALRARLGLPAAAGHLHRMRQDSLACREALGPAAYEALLAEGARCSPDEACVREAGAAERKLRPASEADRSARAPDLGSLTDREREIVGLVARGLADKQVATELCISPRTVDAHLRNVFKKLGVGSRTELAARVLQVT
jgi:predicted ATPase/DNA-binding NarL/FixJ family response regulator